MVFKELEEELFAPNPKINPLSATVKAMAELDAQDFGDDDHSMPDFSDVEENGGKLVTEWLNEVSYKPNPKYVPSLFSIEVVNFIKLVEGGDPENKTPVVHYKMLDEFVVDPDNPDDDRDTINMCHRGIAKSTLKEYLILYLAVHHDLPGFGPVAYALYVSDSIDNGVKKMRKSLEMRWKNSTFLQRWVPVAKFTDVRWEFENRDGKNIVISGFGAKTGVRGTRENNTRPVLALLDDLISDEDARSKTVIAAVEDTVYKAIDYALHPKRRKIIWSGTPFNAMDPLYKAVESGAWRVNVYPVCEKFPCSRAEFRGSWEDRFNYDYVLKQYKKALRTGKIASFNQELMLRIMSAEDRLIADEDIRWYNRTALLRNKNRFNFYITTDFATSGKQAADFSVISVWAYNAKGQWFWVDGIARRQLMDANIRDLFKFAQKYRPQEVGIEVNGQQGGFIPWIQEKMMDWNIWFGLATEGNSNHPGIRRRTDKLVNFQTMVPDFKAGNIFFPKELETTPEMLLCVNELSLVSVEGFKSKTDDFSDTISMLSSLKPWKPSEESPITQSDGMWDFEEDTESHSGIQSYIV